MMQKDQKTSIIEANRTHPTDTGSPEVQVAILTERINQLTEHLKVHAHDMRQAENYAFLRKWGAVRTWWWNLKNRVKDGRTHRYYKCPECGKKLRVPKGKGKISITCPQCGNKFIKKT